MSTISFRQTLTRYMTLAAVVPLLFVAVGGWFTLGSLQRRALMNENTSYAQTVEARVSGHLTRTEVLVTPYRNTDYRDLVVNPLFRGLWTQRLDGVPPLESMLLLDDSGKVVASVVESSRHVPFDLFKGLDKRSAPEYKMAKEAGGPVWSDVHISPISGEPAIDYVFPMKSGTIVLELSLAALGKSTGRTTDSVTPVIVDRNGVVIFHPVASILNQKPNIADAKFVRTALDGGIGEDSAFLFRESSYLAAAVPMRSTGWAILAIRTTSGVQTVVLRSQFWMALVLALSLALAALLAAALSRSLSHPVDDLSKRVAAVATGDYDLPPAQYRHEEFRILSGVLESMSRAVREREEGLAASTRQFRFLVESLSAIPLEYDVSSDRFIYVGPQAEEILGYPVEQWTDLNSWALMVHPDDRDQVAASARDHIKDHRDHDRSYRMVTAGGEVLHVHDIVSVQERPDGSTRLVGVLVDTTVATEMEDLKVAAEVADAASQAKSGFLAYMSHELRTPLNSIIGFSQIMLEGMTGEINEEQARQLGMIRRSGGHLMALVNDILDLEKIERGAVELELSEVNLTDLVSLSIDGLMPLGKRKGLEVRLEEPERSLVVSVDQDKTRQVLLNLLSNAIKYTDEGEVRVTVSLSEDGRAEVAVIDTGSGIADELLEEIFDEFRCIGRAGDVLQESTGLGLAISRRLARLMGGDIAVESVVGLGSTFTLSLPLRVKP